MRLFPTAFLQRKFTCEKADSKRDTYREFRQWIDSEYAGSPSEEQWVNIMDEDSNYDYQAQSPAAIQEQTCFSPFNEQEQYDLGGYQQLPDGPP